MAKVFKCRHHRWTWCCYPHRPGFGGGSNSWKNRAMRKKAMKFSSTVRERAVRLVREPRSEHPSIRAAGRVDCSNDRPYVAGAARMGQARPPTSANGSRRWTHQLKPTSLHHSRCSAQSWEWLRGHVFAARQLGRDTRIEAHYSTYRITPDLAGHRW